MKHYVVIDLEMCKVPMELRKSGRCKREIIQIGAALMDEKYEVIDKFDEYVKPEYGALDEKIRKLTGITNYDISTAKSISEAMTDFLAWLPEGEVIPISWSDADLKQFQSEFAIKNLTFGEGFNRMLESWIDCQKQFSEKMNQKKQYALEEALIATDICTEGSAHNGLVDAYNTALLYQKMQREEKLILNKDYEFAHSDKEPEHLSYNLGDILRAAGFVTEEPEK